MEDGHCSAENDHGAQPRETFGKLHFLLVPRPKLKGKL
jgi:hypothetical protein